MLCCKRRQPKQQEEEYVDPIDALSLPAFNWRYIVGTLLLNAEEARQDILHGTCNALQRRLRNAKFLKDVGPVQRQHTVVGAADY